MIREIIESSLREVAGQESVQVDFNERLEFGDYASNVALVLAKELGRAPRELAAEFQDKLLKNLKLRKFIDKIEIAGPGFLNFFVKKEYLLENLKVVHEEKGEYGRSKRKSKSKKVVVEYSSPNIAKPFSIGHMRSTLIGDAIANLLEANGANVYRDNHIGDWGTQFGKQIYALVNFGEGSLEKNIEKIEASEKPVHELVKLYVEFHEKAEKDPLIEDAAREWFKKLEEGDPEARSLWQKCIDLSWKEFDRIYSVLGIPTNGRFENDGKGYGESYFEEKLPSVVKELKDEGFLQSGEDSAQLVFFPNDEMPPLMILKKDGTSLYATRDLATDKFRLEKYGFDINIVNEVGIEQSLYFKQLYKLEEMLGWVKPGQRLHIKHGHFRLKTGKMSTRKGTVILLEEVLHLAFDKAQLLMMSKGSGRGGWGIDRTTEVIGRDAAIVQGAKDEDIWKVAIGALKWNEYKRDPQADILFDWDEVLSMEGNSGPYMQYTYARIRSVLEKARFGKQLFLDSRLSPSHEVSEEPGLRKNDVDEKELNLMRLISQYPETVTDSAINYSTSRLCNYLYRLASEYNAFYNGNRIIGSENESLRLALSEAVSIVLQNGLNLLGIKTPEKM